MGNSNPKVAIWVKDCESDAGGKKCYQGGFNLNLSLELPTTSESCVNLKILVQTHSLAGVLESSLSRKLMSTVQIFVYNSLKKQVQEMFMNIRI